MQTQKSRIGKLASALFLPWPHLAEAQQAKKIPRIAILRPGSPTDSNIDAFRRGLRELGYVEGKNIVIEYRYA